MKYSNIESYLRRITGEDLQLTSLDSDKLNGLALYLKHGFKFFQAELFDRQVVLAEPVSELEISPGRINQHLNTLTRKLKYPVILVLNSLPSYQRLRFIQRRIPFIIPGQQIYIPKLLVDLKVERNKEDKPLTSFRPATQYILFYHLLVSDLNNLNLNDISKKLGYSTMTISRAKKEFKKAGVLKVKKNGLELIKDKQELWERSLEYLRSPIRETIYGYIKEDERYYLTGLNALARYTNIAGNENRSYAIYYKALDRTVNFDAGNSRRIKIEIWNYPPDLINDRRIVDPLSLYMTMKDEVEDERIEIALEELIQQAL